LVRDGCVLRDFVVQGFALGAIASKRRCFCI